MKLFLAMLLIATASWAQTPGGQFQSRNFQYLTGVLTPSQSTYPTSANAWNSAYPPKFYTLAVTTTAAGFVVKLEGSLDNQNWTHLAQTNTAIGAQSSTSVLPMLYFRLRASTIAAGTAVTATAIGVP